MYYFVLIYIIFAKIYKQDPLYLYKQVFILCLENTGLCLGFNMFTAVFEHI